MILAVHHPHASFSLDLANTSTSWFSTNSVCLPVSFGGKNTWENGNFDSGCQLQNKVLNINKNTRTFSSQILNKNIKSQYLLIFKGYENLVVENVGDNGLKIKRFLEHSDYTPTSWSARNKISRSFMYICANTKLRRISPQFRNT